MFGYFFAVLYKAWERFPVPRDFRQKGFRFHNITPVGDMISTKAQTKNQTQSSVRGLRGVPLSGHSQYHQYGRIVPE
jgi:hypothetical protein